MDRAQIVEVLRDVFGRDIYIGNLGGWVSLHCPLAPWTHASGHDSNPSAGVSVNDNGTSVYNCFTCHNPKPFHAMLAEYAEYSGEDLSSLISEIEENEFLGPRRLPSWDEMISARLVTGPMPLDEAIYMDLYESAIGHPYLKERGISNATARKLELRFDPEDPSDGHPRILFPVRGLDGQLYGFSGRDTSGRAKLKVRDYYGLQKAHMVLGAHLASSEKNVLVVEGLFDYAGAHECGYCGCAVMHSTMTDPQAAIFKEIGKPVYLFYDNPRIDKAGKDGAQLAGGKLLGYVPVWEVAYPRVQIEDESKRGWHWLKDPGELTREEIEWMMANATLFDNRRR